MQAVLIACNVLAGIALALTCRTLAIVIAAPLLAIVSVVVLVLTGLGAFDTFIWLCACLAAGQAAFLLTCWIKARCIAKTERKLEAGDDTRAPDKTLLAVGPRDGTTQPRDLS
jgi:hypothetical protein